jgi:hypothetical protein
MLGTREGLRQSLQLGISDGNECGLRLGTWRVAQLWLLLLPLLVHFLFVFQFKVKKNSFSMFVRPTFTFIPKNKIKTGVTWNLVRLE